jgi:hypothetical protein
VCYRRKDDLFTPVRTHAYIRARTHARTHAQIVAVKNEGPGIGIDFGTGMRTMKEHASGMCREFNSCCVDHVPARV